MLCGDRGVESGNVVASQDDSLFSRHRAALLASLAAAAVRRFYELVNARHYDASYALLSSRLRSATKLVAYRRWYTKKRAISLRRIVRAQALDATTLMLVAEVTSTDVIGGTCVTRDYLDSWTMVREGGVWRLDRVQTRHT